MEETSPLIGDSAKAKLKKTTNNVLWFIFGIVVLVITIFILKQNVQNKQANVQFEETSSSTTQPNIIWFITDDLGYSDISVHSSEIATPNIDSIANSGIEISSHYTMPLCSPTRASLLTGRHSYRMGLQATMTDLVKPASTTHIPVSYKTVGNYFEDAGYDTRLYGKWHAGYSKESYTPVNRGFAHHYGFYQYAIDYYTKNTLDSYDGYDWFKDGEVYWEDSDTDLYTTFLLSDQIVSDIETHAASTDEDKKPLFLYIAFQNPHFTVGVPDTFETTCTDILDDDRAAYCKHVQALDYAIGQVLDALKSSGLYDNSVIALTTDNGALSLNLCGNPGGHSAAGSAYPYRGGKYTLFEGGVKTPAFIGGNLIPSDYVGESTTQMMHAVDWLPTLLHFTNSGSDTALNDDIDGYDMYNVLFKGEENPRSYLTLNIDYKDSLDDYVDTAIIYNGYKLIYNHELQLAGSSCDVRSAKPGSYPFSSEVTTLRKNINYNNLYLFDINNDPNETKDLLEGDGVDSDKYSDYESIIDAMFEIIENEKTIGFMSQQNSAEIANGDSSNFDYAWVSFEDENDDEFVTIAHKATIQRSLQI